MKFFMYGMWEGNEQKQEEPFDTFIGITAVSKADAKRQLKELVGDKAKKFILYDILEA